jgi:Tfp pilus assembly protein FimT
MNPVNPHRSSTGHPRQAGYTLNETLVVLGLSAILLALLLPTILRLLAEILLGIAISELSWQWKITRLDATGNGTTPITLCIRETVRYRIEVAKIQGDRCETVTRWQALIPGVEIDENNSTLRRVSGVAGNTGSIYRVSWADTRSGLGGSWGQLGRLTLIAAGTSRKKCLFLFDTKGGWNIRENQKCNK